MSLLLLRIAVGLVASGLVPRILAPQSAEPWFLLFSFRLNLGTDGAF